MRKQCQADLRSPASVGPHGPLGPPDPAAPSASPSYPVPARSRRRKGHSLAERKAEPAPTENDRQSGAFLLPGLKPVLELLQSSPQTVDSVFLRKGRRDRHTDRILDLCRAAGVRFSLLEEEALSAMYQGNSQGVLARLFEAGFRDFETLLADAPAAPLPLLLALDQVADPGNAGTLIRTLYALGGAGLLVAKHQGAFLGGAAAKASAGAIHRLPIAKVTNLAQALDKAEEAGFTIYGAAAGTNSGSVYELRPDFPAVLVLGSEQSGLHPGIAKRCRPICVPMRREFDSLNVAQAGAIMIGFFGAGVVKNQMVIDDRTLSGR